ncbi:MAG: glycosyltransferase [Pseudomonadota bacterium]
MTADLPKVSLVVVNFDRRTPLALLLRGLEFQRYPRFEIVVVTNLAPEARPESPLPIRWIHFTEANISAARNRGIRAAAGEIVAFCDDDSVPEFGWLTALVAPFANPDVGAAGGYVRGRNGVSFQWRLIRFDRWGRDHREARADIEPVVFPPDTKHCVKTVGTNSAFRRRALVEIGGFDEAFRFYLDEADVNLRLAEAGWSTAIVPLAEVHHGYAEGPHRTQKRVPKSLFEIGASEVVFVRHHAGDSHVAAHCADVRKHQLRRLDQFFLKGLLDSAELKALSATLEAGFEEGRNRRSRRATLAAPDAGFAPVPVAQRSARLIVTRPMQGRKPGRAAARAAAADGAEVTLIEVEASHRNLFVKFTEDGYWRHRFGLFGLGERDRPRRLIGVEARIAEEVARIARQRRLAPTGAPGAADGIAPRRNYPTPEGCT